MTKTLCDKCGKDITGIARHITVTFGDKESGTSHNLDYCDRCRTEFRNFLITRQAPETGERE